MATLPLNPDYSYVITLVKKDQMLNFLRKSLGVLIINLSIVLILLASIETVGLIWRQRLELPSVGWIYRANDLAIESIVDNCTRMRTHPFLTYSHDHRSECLVKGGFSDGPFVFYNKNRSKYAVLTLGGSTTDGLFTHFAEGDTWPYLLNQILLSSQNDYEVINGGVGGYSSSQELLKLLIDGSRIKHDVRYVIALSGENDLRGLRGLDPVLESQLPFWNKTLLDLFRFQKWINQSGTTFIPSYLPNTHWLLDKAKGVLLSGTDGRENIARQRWEDSLMMSQNQERDVAEQWFLNVRITRAIAAELGAEYHVFLQPTMGISDLQTPSNKNSADFKAYEKYASDKEYWLKLNELYKKLRQFCSRLSYCHDITDVAPPIGNFYSDIRHHNKRGTALIAGAIHSKVFGPVSPPRFERVQK